MELPPSAVFLLATVLLALTLLVLMTPNASARAEPAAAMGFPNASVVNVDVLVLGEAPNASVFELDSIEANAEDALEAPPP